jgi:hypothetical protein
MFPRLTKMLVFRILLTRVFFGSSTIRGCIWFSVCPCFIPKEDVVNWWLAHIWNHRNLKYASRWQKIVSGFATKTHLSVVPTCLTLRAIVRLCARVHAQQNVSRRALYRRTTAAIVLAHCAAPLGIYSNLACLTFFRTLIMRIPPDLISF